MDLAIRALAIPFLLNPWFLLVTGGVAIVAGGLMFFYPAPLVQLSLWSDPKARQPSAGAKRWILSPALIAAGLLILSEGWILLSASH